MLIKYFRNNKHLTQSEVARKLQISLRQYQRIESGIIFPRKDSVKNLEDLFQVPYSVLFAKSADDVPYFLKRFLS